MVDQEGTRGPKLTRPKENDLMESANSVRVVWDDEDGPRSTGGELLPEDDPHFLRLLQVDGTEQKISKQRIIRIEIPSFCAG